MNVLTSLFGWLQILHKIHTYINVQYINQQANSIVCRSLKHLFHVFHFWHKLTHSHLWRFHLLQLQRYKQANGVPDVETGAAAAMLPQRKWHSLISPIFVQALTLTFLAEWGDRSQLATIVLAAREVRLQVHRNTYTDNCLSGRFCLEWTLPNFQRNYNHSNCSIIRHLWPITR